MRRVFRGKMRFGAPLVVLGIFALISVPIFHASCMVGLGKGRSLEASEARFVAFEPGTAQYSDPARQGGITLFKKLLGSGASKLFRTVYFRPFFLRWN